MKLAPLKIKKNSVFVSWLVSYVLILLIPIFISGVIYYKSGKIIEGEVNRANGAILDQIQKAFDSEMYNVGSIVKEISLNYKIGVMMNAQNSLDDPSRYTISEIVTKDFSVYSAAGSFINNFYVYFTKGDFILTPGAKYEPEVAYENFHKNNNITYEDWYKLIHQRHYGTSLSLHGNDNSSKGSSIVYINSLPSGNSAPSANLIILLNQKKIDEILQSIQWVKSGSFYIIDNEDHILFSSTSSGIADFMRYEKLENDSGLIHETINGQKLVVAYTTSRMARWKYISIIPVDFFMEKASYLNKINFLGLVMCLFFGGMVAYYFVKRNYNPLRKLLENFKLKGQPALTNTHNEYQIINDTMTDIIKEKEVIIKRLKNQESIMRSHFLGRLLKGRLNESTPVDEALSAYNISFKSDYFAVMLFRIDDYEKLFSNENSKMIEDDKLDLVQFAVRNVVEEVTSQNCLGIATELDGMMACIISFDNNLIVDKGQQLFDIAQKSSEFLKELLFISTTAAVSNVHQSIIGIAQAYQEALEAMEYKMVIGSGKIIMYKNIASDAGKTYKYSLELEQQIINYVKLGDLENARQAIDQVFHINITEASLPIYMVKCLMFDLLSTMIKTIDEICGENKSELWEKIKPLEKLLAFQTADELRKEMYGILESVFEYINLHKKHQSSAFKNKLIEYINNNFSNSYLNISIIAEHFNMNASYLSRFFKEQTGVGMLDYINRMRLEKSKQLLLENGYNINEVAEKVGYYNNVALIRAFKKYEGITPGQFKKLT